MMSRTTSVAFVLGLVVGGAAIAQDVVGRVLFIAEDDNGKVWANLSLTGQRMDEPYVPMVVAVENKLQKPATVDRDSFWLEDLEGIVYVLPTVKEQRKNYKKTVMDYRTVSYAGIPWESWQYNRRLETTNFFPNLQSNRGNVVRDKATLRQRHAMVNLMYFERPRNLELGKPFFLVVRPEGWETPIRLRLVIS
jgi:hypothetical protein